MKYFLKLKNGDFPCFDSNSFFIRRRVSFIANLLSYYYENVPFPYDDLKEIAFVQKLLGERVKKIEKIFVEKYPFFSLYSFSCVSAVFHSSQYHEGLFLLKFFPDLDAIYFRFEDLFGNTIDVDTVFSSFSQAKKFINSLEKRYKKVSSLSYSLSI